MSVEAIEAAIRDVPDFPKPGIVFKDITPVLADGRLLRAAIDLFATRCRELRIAKIVAIDARGFLFGAPVADRLGLGLVPVRKAGKLPWRTEEIEYELEYGTSTVAVHTDAFCEGERVVLIDDLLATGGTAAAAVALIRRAGAELVEAQFLIELAFLKGRERLAPYPVYAPVVVGV